MSEENYKEFYDIDIVKEANKSFLSYAMSVIVSRAIPDIRDGLKPVHRRILFSMFSLGMTHNKPYKKSARIVGEVLAKYHPHGDAAAYESLVRMAQSFSMRYPLVDGQGNFGSIDGDRAAAMRYTESRLTKLSWRLVDSINYKTVNFVPNYDETEKEPVLLPVKFPNLLVNGSVGIAVGIATSIPPHNLTETINAVIAYAHNNDIDLEGLLEHIKGPDFPTGAKIIGNDLIIQAYRTGKGQAKVFSNIEVEEGINKNYLIVTEIPYMVNKAQLIEKIALLVKNETIKGITDIRDESNRKGIRIVIELKKSVIPNLIINRLYKYSRLSSTFSMNLIGLVNEVPKLYTLKGLISEFWKFRKDCFTKEKIHFLAIHKKRNLILSGLRKAISNIDEVISIIKKAKSPKEAEENLIKVFDFLPEQSKAILDMKLQRINSLETQSIDLEISNLKEKIGKIETILSDENVLKQEIIKELEEIKDSFGDKRRTVIIPGTTKSIEDEDLIPRKNMIVTFSQKGYIKRNDVEDFREQRRGGMGANIQKLYKDDSLSSIFFSNTHNDLLFFTNQGRVFRSKCYVIPLMNKNSRGTSIVNLLDLQTKEKIIKIIKVKDYSESKKIVFFTKKGMIKVSNFAENFTRINVNGKKAITLKEGDTIASVIVSNDSQDKALIGVNTGRISIFKLSDIRSSGRVAIGVKGVKLRDGEFVVHGTIGADQSLIFSLTDKGHGKLSKIEDYRVTSRNSRGVLTIPSKDNQRLKLFRVIKGDEMLLVSTTNGRSILFNLSNIKIQKRNTKGVRIINFESSRNRISYAAVIPNLEPEPEAEQGAEQ